MTLRRVFRNECARLARDESGVAVVFTLCSFLFLFACCTSVWFVGENVRRKAELQNACDAAAYSAAVVQADGLSRMAVVNRAMSWCYVQMTKMQMDYITLRWLELTKERFEKDRRNGDRTALLRMFSDKAGFHSLSREWRSWYMIIPRMILEIIGIHIYLGVENVDFWFAADCKDKTHRHEHDSGGNGSYIGFRLTQSDNSKIGCVRVNSSSRDATVLDRYVEKTRIDEAVEDLQVMYGEKGWRLEALIGALKNAIITCNALLPVINRQMAVAIEETAVRTLQENLPRAPDGRIDQKLVDSYRWTVAGGVSRPPTQYATGMVGGVLEGVSPILNFVSHPYFSGLCNTEEDELAFLNMADGVPDHTGEVKLIDYFADNGKNRRWKQTPAAGLDQWFIRCDPRESAIADQVQVVREFKNAPAGIVRAYKNANYREGACATSALQKLFGMKGIHRGNYVTDILDGGTIDSAVSGLSGIFGFRPSKLINPGSKPRNPFKRIKWRAKRTLQKALRKLDGPIEAFMAPIQNTIGKIAGIAKTLEQAAFGVGVDPSCNNERLRFIDKCANVPDSTGLVSEWEWASAYWFCNWGRLRATGIVNFDVRWCMHPFLPVAAIHGGRSDAKPNVLLHSAGDTGGYGGTDRYGAKWKNYLFGLFGKVFPWFSEEVKMYSKQGHSRDKYRSSFVGLDGDAPSLACSAGHNTFPIVGYGGLHSNYLLKGFSRVYGDDKAVYNGYYQGVPCQPWVLNRRFFEGGGTIVVGVARKQSNFFADLFDDLARKADILDKRSLYSAFTPADGRQHFVALAAGRAGWAPRCGHGRADGTDSVNAGRDPARVYEVRYDSVTDRKFGPEGHPVLPQNVPGVSSADLVLLQNHGRIGCACGNHNTTARLRRQWNLSQTDWDGVLLPLRYAHAKPDPYDSVKDGAEQKTDWSFSLIGSFTSDDASASVAGMLWDHAVWRKFGETELGGGWFSKSNEGSSMKTKDVLPLPVDVDDRTPADLIRKRRIL